MTCDNKPLSQDLFYLNRYLRHCSARDRLVRQISRPCHCQFVICTLQPHFGTANRLTICKDYVIDIYYEHIVCPKCDSALCSTVANLEKRYQLFCKQCSSGTSLTSLQPFLLLSIKVRCKQFLSLCTFAVMKNWHWESKLQYLLQHKGRSCSKLSIRYDVPSSNFYAEKKIRNVGCSGANELPHLDNLTCYHAYWYFEFTVLAYPFNLI